MTETTPTISVLEYGRLDFGEGPQCLAPREAVLLEELPPDVCRKAFTRDEQGITFSHYVGMLRVGDRAIEILPKVARAQSASSRIHLRRMLVYLLALAGEVPWAAAGSAALAEREAPLLEAYIHAFAAECARLLRRGAVKDYVQREAETEYLRGALRIAEQIELDMRRVPRFAVRYNEFTADTRLNRILKDVSNRLAGVTESTAAWRLLGTIDAMLDDVADVVHAPHHLCEINLDRRTRAYTRLLRICAAVLQGWTPEVYAGPTPAFAFVFDMNRIFEDGVRALLRTAGARVRPREERDAILMTRHTSDSTDQVRLLPDIVIDSDSGTTVIDTKWKMPSTPGSDATSDLYQAYAYARTYRVRRTILLYPTAGEVPAVPDAKYDLDTAPPQWIESWRVCLTCGAQTLDEYCQAVGERLSTILGYRS